MPNPIIDKCLNNEPLSWSEYTEGVLRTASGNFHGHSYNAAVAIAVMQNFVDASNMLDEMKKALYYGRDTQTTCYRHLLALGVSEEEFTTKQWPPKLDNNLLHSLVGIATESGELIEAVVNCLTNDNAELDLVNLKEELGDVLWYVALMLTCLESDINPVMRINLLKLYKRFPEKFTELNANQRDLATERQVLERGYF